jgi:dihydrodipicolinate synthase/N-acetylneuraminate lyase
MKWQGVIPAITTPFVADLSVDADLLVKQVNALVNAGCSGVVALVRPPRLPVASPEREAVLDLVRHALARRPALG